MIYEYATDPALLATWRDLREWYPNFGLDQGRLISNYPNGWAEFVWAAAKGHVQGLTPLDQKRYEQRLKELKDGALVRRSDAVWDQRLTWLANAQREHTRRAFQAVLIKDGHPGNDVILRGDRLLDEGNDRFEAPAGRSVPRDPDKMAQALAPLLRMSNEIVFVDRYLTLHAPDSPRRYAFVQAVLRLLARSRSHLPGLTFEIQTDFRGAPRDLPPPNKAGCQADLERVFRSVLPRGAQLELYRLHSLPDGDRIHNRYVLTEVGGVLFGTGLDVASNEAETDDLNRLGRVQYGHRWKQYYLDRRLRETHELLGRIP